MKEYEINQETLILLPTNSNSTKIIEINQEEEIYKNTAKIIDESCKFFGSSYLGRFEGTKNMIGISKKSPIIIEETKNIIFFPTTSPRIEKCIWISLNNLERYIKNKEKTLLIFSCGKKILIDIPFNIIDNQVLRSTKLESILRKRKEKTIK